MIAGIVLAAGTSSRLGEPKQLLVHRGKPLVQHAIDAGASLDVLVVVVGHEAKAVRDAIELPDDARIVHNASHAEGQSTSLRVGLEAVGSGAGAAVVLLADQPGVDEALVRQVIERWRSSDARFVRVRYPEGPSHPVLLDRAIWDEVKAVTGDRGARELVRDHPDWLAEVELPGPRPPDVDTREDYEALGE